MGLPRSPSDQTPLLATTTTPAARSATVPTANYETRVTLAEDEGGEGNRPLDGGNRWEIRFSDLGCTIPTGSCWQRRCCSVGQRRVILDRCGVRRAP